MNRYRYLNGIDWIITGLDQSLRQTAGIGNRAQLVLELDGRPDTEKLRAAARRYASAFPVLQGRSVRGWQLVPVWKIPRRIQPVDIPVSETALDRDASFENISAALGSGVAFPAEQADFHIGFHLFYCDTKTFLAFHFDHRLFDARGAELFFLGFVDYLNSGKTDIPDQVEVPYQKPCLPPWIPKFKSGQKVVRMLHSQRRETAPFHFEPKKESGLALRFSVLPLSREQSDRLLNRAYDEAGYLMLTPWLAEKMVGAVEQLLAGQGRSLNGYVIPCSADLRDGSDPARFFNHVAFICLSRKNGPAPEKGWAQHFSAQFVEQVKEDMPRHFENAWKLARIIPAGLFGRLLRNQLKQFAGTFSMASVGDGLSAVDAVAGCPVRNAFHMPVVPPAPGLGFFANTFQGRLNICVTSSDGVLDRAEHEQLAEQLKTRLVS